MKQQWIVLDENASPLKAYGPFTKDEAEEWLATQGINPGHYGEQAVILCELIGLPAKLPDLAE